MLSLYLYLCDLIDELSLCHFVMLSLCLLMPLCHAVIMSCCHFVMPHLTKLQLMRHFKGILHQQYKGRDFFCQMQVFFGAHFSTLRFFRLFFIFSARPGSGGRARFQFKKAEKTRPRPQKTRSLTKKSRLQRYYYDKHQTASSAAILSGGA